MGLGVRKAGYKGSVGLVKPAATGSHWGHGCLAGFPPPLLNKHTARSHWSPAPANQRAAAPPYYWCWRGLSALTHWLRVCTILYESARQRRVLPAAPLHKFALKHGDVTKHDAAANFLRLCSTFQEVFAVFTSTDPHFYAHLTNTKGKRTDFKALLVRSTATFDLFYG